MAKRMTEGDLTGKMGLVKNPDGTYSMKSKPGIFKLLDKPRPPFSVKDDGILKDTWSDATTRLSWGSKPIAVFTIDPIGAPRMTRSDQWKTNPFHKDTKKRQRKPVTQYFRFKDNIILQAREQSFELPDKGFHVVFVVPMPHSWSESKKAQMGGAPHQQKPDTDNMIKAVKDSLCKDDAHIWDYRISKIWGRSGKILIYQL